MFYPQTGDSLVESRPGFVVTCNHLGGKLWHPFTGGGVQASVNLSRLPVVREVSEFTHALRESWRYCQWQSFTKAQRRDSMNLRWYPYDPQGCQAARKRVMHQGGHIHAVACMTGAFVSPLRFARIHPSFDGKCFWCGSQLGSKHHMIWQCPALRGAPSMQEDLLEQELGWPVSAGRTSVLEHMARVRQERLQKRWRREPSWGGGSKHSLPIFVGVLLCCGVRQCLLNNGGVVALLENSSKFLGNILLFYYWWRISLANTSWYGLTHFYLRFFLFILDAGFLNTSIPRVFR